jgi:hypothetical protein
MLELTHTHAQMKRNLLLSPVLYLTLILGALAQSGPAPVASPANGTAQGQPVSYASVTQLNGLLSQIESTSKNTQADLSRLRIERWKTDSANKKEALATVDSIQRNLQGALPEIIAQLRNAPEDLQVSFKLYRNLDALYSVMRDVVDGVGAFGSKDDVQTLSNDLSAFEGSRKQLAERIENLSSSKEQELAQLRVQLKTLQAQVEAEPPKKVVVDDTEPAKKPAPKKKTAPKKPADTAKPPANPPQQQGQTNPQ